MKGIIYKTFIFLLIGVSYFSLLHQSFSQELASPSAVTNRPSDYFLPYPGILSDNPLYFLKVTRDKIIELLIADPLKKSQFDLLQADKRMNLAVYLSKEKSDRSSHISAAVSKAENYFEKALINVQQAKAQGENIDDMAKNLSLALQKHKEVITELLVHADGALARDLRSNLKRIEGFKKTVIKITPQ